MCRFRSINTLNNHLYFCHCFIFCITFSDKNTGTSVTAVHTCTCYKKVANSSKACKCHRVWTHGNSKSCNLCYSSRYKCSFCIISIAKAISNTGSKCYNVL